MSSIGEVVARTGSSASARRDDERLVAAEAARCAFLSSTLGIDDGGVTLEVHAPSDAQSFVQAVFGEPARPRT